MKRRRAIALGVAVLLAAAVSFVILDPEARVRARLAGEPFFGGRAATAWRNDLRDKDEVKATAAREALTAGKADAIPVCTWLLQNAPEPEVRGRAADALRQMGADAKPAGEALLAALGDPDPVVRGVAAQAIEGLAPDLPAGALPRLYDAFPTVEAIRAVAKYRAAAGDAVPRLIPLLAHEQAAVRINAIRTFGYIGPAAAPVAGDLIRLMGSDPVPKVREISAESLGRIGPLVAGDAVIPLARALKDSDTMVRRDAVRSLGQLGAASRPVLAEVKALQKDPEEIVRKAADAAVAAIEAPK